MLNRITLKARFILSGKSVLTSNLAMIKIFSVCTARSTALDPMCSLGGLYSISMFLFLQNSL